MMYKSQFWKIYPYDWFCGPGSQINNNNKKKKKKKKQLKYHIG